MSTETLVYVYSIATNKHTKTNDMSYLQMIDQRTKNDLVRLCKRPEGLTVEVDEFHSSPVVITKETFKDIELAAEFVYSFEGQLKTVITFNY